MKERLMEDVDRTNVKIKAALEREQAALRETFVEIEKFKIKVDSENMTFSFLIKKLINFINYWH